MRCTSKTADDGVSQVGLLHNYGTELNVWLSSDIT